MGKIKKPIKRSKLRSFLGKHYYIIRRTLSLYTSNKKLASNIDRSLLPYELFSHSTPLLRKLKDVDMQFQYNKITNLKLATKKVSGIVIKPGETFSYWKLIGKPTYKKGYLDGIVLSPNGGFMPGVGGGLCQFSNLIYWMTLHTPLQVVERYRHSHDVFPDVNRTQPFGSGATCVYNYLDLQIYNGTNDEYQLIVEVTDNELVGKWLCSSKPIYSYRVYESYHSMTPGIWGGYVRNNKINRKVYNLEGAEIRDDFITENHAIMMYNPYLEANKE